MRHNLSPRGDGNASCSVCKVCQLATQLIPARGRKLDVMLLQSTTAARHNLSPRGDGNSVADFNRVQRLDTTYPREGTETYFCFALLSLLSNLTQLIPARGRKRFDLLFFRHLYPTQLIPARGRKPNLGPGALL